MRGQVDFQDAGKIGEVQPKGILCRLDRNTADKYFVLIVGIWRSGLFADPLHIHPLLHNFILILLAETELGLFLGGKLEEAEAAAHLHATGWSPIPTPAASWRAYPGLGLEEIADGFRAKAILNRLLTGFHGLGSRRA